MDDLDEDGSFNLSGFALLDVSNTYLSEGSKQPNFDKKNKLDFPHKENIASFAKADEENKDELLKSNNAEEDPAILSKSLFDIDVSLNEKLKVKSIGNELAELQAARFVDGEFSQTNEDDGFTAIESQSQPENKGDIDHDPVQRIQLDQQKTEDENLKTSCLNSSNSYNGCGEFSTETTPDENIGSGKNFNQSLLTEKRERNLKSSNLKSSPIVHFPETKSLSKTFGDETSFSLSLSTIEYSQCQPEKIDERELMKNGVDGETGPLEMNKEISQQTEPKEKPSDASGKIFVNETKIEPEMAHDKSSREILSKSLFDIDVSITEKTAVKSIESELSEIMAPQSNGVPKENSSTHEQTNVTECELEPEKAHDKSSKEILSKSLFDIDVSITEKTVVKSIESELSELLAPLSINGVPKEKSSVINEQSDLSFSTSVTEVMNGPVFGEQEKAKEISEGVESKPQEKTDFSGEMIRDVKNNKTGAVQMEETTEASLFLEVSTFNQTQVEETEEISATAKTDKVLEIRENIERMDDVEQVSVDIPVQTQKEENAEISLSLEVSTVNDQTQVEETSVTAEAVSEVKEVIESIDGIEKVAVDVFALEVQTLKEKTAETSGILPVSSINDRTHQEDNNAVVEDFKINTPETEDDSSPVEPKSEDQIDEANGPSADIAVPEPTQKEETVEISLFLEVSSINDQTQAETIDPAIVDEIVVEQENIKETSLDVLSPNVNLEMKPEETTLSLEVSTINDQTQMVDANETSLTNESVVTPTIEEVTSNKVAETMDDIKEACMDSSILKVHLESNDNEEIVEKTSGNTAKIDDKTPETAFSEDLSVETAAEQERVDDIKSAEDHFETAQEDENESSLLQVSSIKEQTQLKTSLEAKLEDETPLIEDMFFEDATTFLAAEQEQMYATEEPSADLRVETIHEEETSGTSFHLEVSSIDKTQMEETNETFPTVKPENVKMSEIPEPSIETSANSSRNVATAKEPEQTMEDVNESSKSSVTDLVAEQIQFNHDASGDIFVPASHFEPTQSETTQYEAKDSETTPEDDPKIDVEYSEIQESNEKSEDIFVEIESELDEMAIEPRQKDDAKKRLVFTSVSEIFEEKATNKISNDVAVAEISITITPVEEAIETSCLRGQLPLGTISEENLSEDSEMDKENDGKTPPGKLRKKLRMAISDFDYINKEFKELQKFTKLELQTIKADLMAKSELNEQLTEANEMIEKLQFSHDEMSHLKRENESLKTENVSLKTENNKIKNECDLIKSKVVEEEILRESNEARWKRREEELQNSLEESWRSLDETQKRLSDALKVSSEDGSLQKISKDENERLKKELDEQFLLVEQLSLSKASSEETAKNSREENLYLKEQLEEMIALKAELLSSVKSLEENILHKSKENLNLKDYIEDQKKAKEEILSHVKTLEECAVEKDEKLQNLNEELEEQLKKIEKKNQEIQVMKEFEESLLSSVKNLEKTLKNKEEEYSELVSTLAAKEKEYEDSLNALNVLIQHQDSELNQLKRRSTKIETDLSKTLIPNSTINDISLCMSVRESPVRKFLSPRKNLNTTNDSLSTTIPESMHSIYLVDKTIQQSEEFEPFDPLNDSDEQFGTPNSSQIGEANFTFVEDPTELNTIKTILNSEDVVNSVQGLVSEIVALKENLEESHREIASCQILIDSFNRLFNHENLEPKALMEININKMAEIKFDELNFFESVLEYKNNSEKLKSSLENLHKEKNDRENELQKSHALIELINEAFSFDGQDVFANVERISRLKEVFPQSNLIGAIFECKNENEKLQNLVENMLIESKNTENLFKKSLDFIELINKVFDFDGQDALPVIELNICRILKLKEAFPQSNLIDAIFSCKNDNEKLQNLVDTLQNELDVKENELKKSLDSIEFANTIFNSDGQDTSDFESNLNRIKKLKAAFPNLDLMDAILDCKKTNENLTRQLSKMKGIAKNMKEVQNCQDQLKDFIFNFKSSIDSKLKEAINLTSLTQTCENVEITDIQNINLLVREISKTCDFDDADILTSLKMIKSYVNENKQGVEMVLNLLNHSTDDFWNFIFEKIRSLQEELLEKYSFDEKVRDLKNELSDADDFKQKFANELAALQPQNDVRDLMKLPLIELHAKMLSTIMEKEQVLLDDMRKEYEDKLQVTSDQNRQIEEELKRCKRWISELESENEKINKEYREIKVGSESVQEALHQKTTMLDKIKDELREASEKLNDRSSQVCYCNKSDLLSERFEDLSLLLKQKTESCEIYERKFNESSIKVIALEKLINDKEIEIKNLKNKLEAKADEEAIKEKELKNTINTLNGDLKRLQNELNEAKKSKGDKKLEQEIADLTEKMKSDEKCFGTLRKNLSDDLKVKALRIKELESKVKATVNEYKSILNMKNEECEKLENKIKELIDFVNKLEKQHISSKETYLKDKKKYEAQISTMSDQLKEVSDKLTQVDIRITILEEIEKILSTNDCDVVRVLKEKLSELKKIAESLEEEKEKCTQLDQENDDMCATLKHYEKENCDYINKVCDYEKIVEKYTSDFKEISSENSNLLKKLEARNIVEEKLINDLRQQQTISNQLEKKFKESQDECEKKITNYEKMVEKLGSDMKILTQKNEELQKRLDTRNERQEECETELKKKDNFLRRSEERLKAYKADYQNILEENQNLQAQIEIVNAKLTKALNDLANAQLNPNETQNGKAKNNSLQKENVQLSCNLMALNEKNGKLEYEVESLKQALKEKNDSISRYRAESGSDFENKLKECENKILTFEKENLILKKLAQKRLTKINLYEDRLKNLGCFSETDVPSRDASASLKPNTKP